MAVAAAAPVLLRKVTSHSVTVHHISIQKSDCNDGQGMPRRGCCKLLTDPSPLHVATA